MVSPSKNRMTDGRRECFWISDLVTQTILSAKINGVGCVYVTASVCSEAGASIRLAQVRLSSDFRRCNCEKLPILLRRARCDRMIHPSNGRFTSKQFVTAVG